MVFDRNPFPGRADSPFGMGIGRKRKHANEPLQKFGDLGNIILLLREKTWRVAKTKPGFNFEEMRA